MPCCASPPTRMPGSRPQSGIVCCGFPADFFRGRPAADLALRADALNRMREAVDGIIIGAALAALFGILNFVLLIYYGGRLAWIAAGLALVQASLLLAASLVQIRLQRRLL